MFVVQLLWMIGIHDNQTIKPIREPPLLGATTVNISTFEQGKKVSNITTTPFWDAYMGIGDSGLTIDPLIVVVIATRHKKMKEIAKLSIGPGLFNINESVIFGTPTMLNPILAVPFITTPLVTDSIGYFAALIGLAGKAVMMVPWTTPPLINTWLSTVGSMGAVVTQFICIVIVVFTYLPLVKIASRHADAAQRQADSRQTVNPV